MISEKRRELIAVSVEELLAERAEAFRFLSVAPGEPRQAAARMKFAESNPPTSPDELDAHRRDVAIVQVEIAARVALTARHLADAEDFEGALFRLLDGQKIMTGALGTLVGMQMARNARTDEIRRLKIDWAQLIVNVLMHRGRDGRRITATELARDVGCANSRITRLREGNTEPMHTLGERLIRIHVDKIGPPPQLLPKGKIP